MVSFSLIFPILFLLGELWLKIAFQYFKGFLKQHIIELRAVISNATLCMCLLPVCAYLFVYSREKRKKERKILQHEVIGTLTD